MQGKQINLGIAEDHILYLRILEEYLTGKKDINVKVRACDGLDLFEKLKYASVEILLLDLFMSKMSGFDVIKTLQNEYPDIKILVLSVCHDLNTISGLLDFGIHGYLSKSDEPEELITAIRVISTDQIYRNKWFTDALYWYKEKKLPTEKNSNAVSLDDREKLILELLWEEKTNKEIADLIYLSTRSVEKIRQNMKEKLNVRSTIGLFKYAIKNNIIKDSEKLH